MQIRDLEAVIAVYKYNSFSEAALKTNFSVSAISKQIARVEKELNIEIFERKNRSGGRFLTREGEILIPLIQETLDKYSNLITQVKSFSETDPNHLTLGYVPLIGSMGENEIISRFNADYPDVCIDFVCDSGANLVSSLISGNMDGIFILMMGAVPSTMPLFEAITNEELRVIQIMRNHNLRIGMSVNHPLASKEKIRLEEIINETFIFSMLQNEARYDNRIGELQKLLDNKDHKIKSRIMDYRNRDVVLRLVENGSAVLPQIVNPVTEGRKIKYVEIEGWPDEAAGLFICRKSNSSATLKNFLKYVKTYSKEQGY